jgi:hypothetical protein
MKRMPDELKHFSILPGGENEGEVAATEQTSGSTAVAPNEAE